MSGWLLSLITISLIAVSIIRGFRKGFRRQVPQMFGLMIGAVCAHIFRVPLQLELMKSMPFALHRPETEFVYSTIACGIIFLTVFCVFTLCLGVFSRALRRRESSVVDSMGGALVTLLIYTMFLSLVFNFLICLKPRSELSAAMTHSDANILSEVLMVAPLMMGSQSPEELAHLLQLDDARRISI